MKLKEFLDKPSNFENATSKLFLMRFCFMQFDYRHQMACDNFKQRLKKQFEQRETKADHLIYESAYEIVRYVIYDMFDDWFHEKEKFIASHLGIEIEEGEFFETELLNELGCGEKEKEMWNVFISTVFNTFIANPDNCKEICLIMFDKNRRTK